jgi:hypothetical protein
MDVATARVWLILPLAVFERLGNVCIVGGRDPVHSKNKPRVRWRQTWTAMTLKLNVL